LFSGLRRPICCRNGAGKNGEIIPVKEFRSLLTRYLYADPRKMSFFPLLSARLSTVMAAEVTALKSLALSLVVEGICKFRAGDFYFRCFLMDLSRLKRV
jgi:hypothetical protein